MIAQELTTARLTLRRPQPEDLDPYTAYCASERTRFVGGPFDSVKAFDKLAAMAGHWLLRGFGRYVMVHDGSPIGHVGPLAADAHHTPEMTWTLWRGDKEGQGFATEGARAVCDHLLEDAGWPGLRILILPENNSSLRIAQRLGAIQTDDPAPTWYPGAVTFWLGAAVCP